MTPAQFDRVLGACRLFVAMGGKIKPGIFGVVTTSDRRGYELDCVYASAPRACALSALLLSAPPPRSSWVDPGDFRAAAAAVLGARTREAAAFILGFDGFAPGVDDGPWDYGNSPQCPYPYDSSEARWWASGVRMRRELAAEGATVPFVEVEPLHEATS